MSYISIILLAIALSIDACVVSFSYGITFTEKRLKNSLSLAICTGLFQGIMPTIGYYLTGFVKSFIEPYAGLIVLMIFTYLGLKIIKEAFDTDKEKPLCIDLKCLLLVGIATSIDAFASGITLKLTHTPLMFSALIIGLMSFWMSAKGFWLAVFFQKLPSRFLEITGGLILIVMAIRSCV